MTYLAYENRDYTHLSENEKQKLEFIAQAIRNKAYGIDVRESIALAIEWVNREYKLTIENNILTLREFENAKSKVTLLEGEMDEFLRRYSSQIAGNTDINEVIDARYAGGVRNFNILGERLDHYESTSLKFRNRDFKNDTVSHKFRKPFITIIDDDCSEQVYSILGSIMNEYSIPISAAVIPSFIEGGQGTSGFTGTTLTKGQMYELQSNGMEFVYHSWKHDKLYDLSYDELHEDFSKGKKWMDDHGFDGQTAIVYPYGANDAKVNQIARYYFDCGIDVDEGVGVSLQPPLNQYNIKRIFDTYGVAKAKSEIDKAALNRGWIIYGTHVWYDTFNESELREVIEYALSKGLTFGTVKEGLEMFGNIIDIPIQNSNETLLVDADGNGNIFQQVYLEQYDAHTISNVITDFNYRAITITPITATESKKTGYPIAQGGLLKTYNVTTSAYHRYQVYEGITTNSTRGVGSKVEFIRFWINDQWTEFKRVGGLDDTITATFSTDANWSGNIEYAKSSDGRVSVRGKVVVGDKMSIGTVITYLQFNPGDYYIHFDAYNFTKTTPLNNAFYMRDTGLRVRDLGSSVKGDEIRFSFSYQSI